MTDILTAEDFDAVRALLDTDSTIVSDSLLSSFPFLPTIEILVKAAISDWSTLRTAAGDDWTLLKTATACLLAMRVARARFSSSVTVGAGFKVGGYSESGRSVNWTGVISELKGMATEALSKISTVTRTRPTFITASGPTSSESAVPTDWEQWIERILPRVLDWVEEGGEDDTYV